LNEGFATYSESLYLEKAYGYNYFMNDVEANMRSAKNAQGSIYVEDITDVNQIFNSARSYAKSAIVLHMLRGVLGDDDFFQTLYDYAHDPEVRFASAVTEDFQGVAETVSGMDLDWFFQQWIYDEGYPKYAFGWSGLQDGDSYTVSGLIEQKQSVGPVFKMPIELVVEYADGTNESFIVWDSTQSQSFEFTVSKEPAELLFDPNNWILKDVSEILTNPALNKGTLLVNGLSWDENVQLAYSSRAYWGNVPISFWDLENPPDGGYPTELPNSIGNGLLETAVLGQYSTVVWISKGNDSQKFNKELIKDYLNFGGNLVLLTSAGRNFLDTELKEYAGIEWNETVFSNLQNFTSVYTGLTDISVTGSQSFVNTLDINPTKNSTTILYQTTEGFDSPKVTGAFSDPDTTGKLVLLTCKPHLFDFNQLSSNMEYILTELIGEPLTNVEDDDQSLAKTFEMKEIYPNPFNPTTSIQFTLPENRMVNISVFNIIGEKVSEIINADFTAGTHKIQWNASNQPSGVYFIRLNAGDFNSVKKAILLK
jgi:hypothetical protein